MLLSEQTIRQYVIEEYIGVDPLPTEEQFQPASLDVRMGDQLTYKDGTEADGIRLKPRVLYLGHTKETISLPNDIAAMLAGRSTTGRNGVTVHKTAGWIDPGFTGQLTLEMFNFGNELVTFEPGERIGQLVFFELDAQTDGYDGKYQGQKGATGPK